MRKRTIIYIATAISGVSMLAIPTSLYWLNAIDYPSRVNLTQFDWTAVGVIVAIAAALTNALLLVSIVIGIESVKQGNKTRTAELLVWAMSQMDEVKAAETSLRDRAERPYAEWRDNADARKEGQAVLNAYSRMAYLANNGFLEADRFRELWGPNFVIQWLILRDRVMEDRKRFRDKATKEDDRQIIRHDFEKFAIETIDHLDKVREGMVDAYARSLKRSRAPGQPHELAPI